MKNIPFILIFSRIIIAILIGILAISKTDGHAIFIVILMVIGLLTDVFDGIIARKLNVSSENLRIWDSNVDQFFWIVTVISIFYLHFQFVLDRMFWIILVIALEIIAYIFFKKYLK
jgi:CDP-diacylglycerol--glycerol-3-phosphate 3-phosphatidyltransferase